MGLDFHMLGTFGVRRDGMPVTLPRSKKARAVLAYVAMGRRPIPRDTLVELFFSETKDPKGGLRWVTSRLRAALGKDAIGTTPSSIEIPGATLDVAALEQPMRPDTSVADLESMESVIQGEFLADLSVGRCPGYEAWRLSRQVEFTNRHTQVLTELVRKSLGSPSATRHARKLVNLDVTREDSWAQLVESLLATNQLADARHIQRLAVEQLERDSVRLSGKLEDVWHRYGSSDRTRKKTTSAAARNGLGLKPRVAVLPTRVPGEDRPYARALSDAVFRACNVNKTVTVLAPSMSARLEEQSAASVGKARDLGVDLFFVSHVSRRRKRIMAEIELVDATSGDCRFTWKRDFDPAAYDEIPDRLEAYLAARMEIDLPIALVSLIREKSPDDMTARDQYLLALPRIFSADGFDPFGAYELLESALARQPYFGQACCALSLIRLFMPQYNDNDDQLAITLSLARRAVEICQDDAFVLGIAAVNIAHITRDTDTGLDLARRALSINPSSVMAGLSSAMISHYAGDDESCLRYVDAVEANSETEPITYICQTCRAMAHYQQHEYEEALEWSRKAVGHNPKHVIAMRYLLASLARTGADSEARALAQRLAAIDPSENVAFFERRSAYRSRSRTAHLCEGLRLGGLPETA